MSSDALHERLLAVEPSLGILLKLTRPLRPTLLVLLDQILDV